MSTGNLRKDIESIAASYEAFPKHPYDKLEANFNQTGLPPHLDFSDPRLIPDLHRAPQRLRELVHAGQITPQRMNEVLVALRQHQRARNHERALPGEYMGDPSLPHLPLPFQHREQRHPLYGPAHAPTPAGQAMDAAVVALEAEAIQRGLAERMGTGRALARIAQREDSRPPSLHELLSTAIARHVGPDGQIGS